MSQEFQPADVRAGELNNGKVHHAPFTTLCVPIISAVWPAKLQSSCPVWPIII